MAPDIVVATLLQLWSCQARTLNPEWEWHQVLWKKIRSRILVLTQETPKGEVFQGRGGGRLPCARAQELCLVITKAQSSKPFHSATNSLFCVVQGCLVPTLLRYC